MYDHVCMVMYVWLCVLDFVRTIMYDYVCMTMYVWLCMCDYVCKILYKR